MRQRGRSLRQLHLVGRCAASPPKPWAEEFLGVVVGFRLHVLGQRQRHRPTLGGVREHAHRLRQALQDLLGPGNPIPPAGHRPETVIHAQGRLGKTLDLLQDRVWPAAREDIARQQQERQPVGVGGRGGRYHVGGARADRARARHQASAPVLLGEGDGGERHGLLDVGSEGRQLLLGGGERLAEPRDVPVAEDGEDAPQERRLAAVDLAPLGHQEAHERLGHGETQGAHRLSSRPLCCLVTAASQQL